MLGSYLSFEDEVPLPITSWTQKRLRKNANSGIAREHNRNCQRIPYVAKISAPTGHHLKRFQPTHLKRTSTPTQRTRSTSGNNTNGTNNYEIDSDGSIVMYEYNGTDRSYQRCIVCFKYKNNVRNIHVTTAYYCDKCQVPVCKTGKSWIDEHGSAYICWNDLHETPIFQKKGSKKIQEAE